MNAFAELFPSGSLVRGTMASVETSEHVSTYRYILLTGPMKLSRNEVCKIGGDPGAKHEGRSQILKTEFPNNGQVLHLFRFSIKKK